MAPNIPPKMKAVQLTTLNKPYIITTEAPVPSDLGPHDLLLKVAVASYCHTDAMVVEGTFGTPLPCIPSHEGAGTVVLAGSAVSASDFSPGDRVMAGQPLHPCGECGDCTGPETYRQYCARIDGHVGVQVDGCFAEYVRVDARHANKLPDKVSFLHAAPLACAGKTVWRGVQVTGLQRSGQWLAILGAGGALGHLAIQFAKGLGLKVVGIEAREQGLELATRVGADVVLDARKGKDETVRKVQEVTGGHGADATIILADVPEAMALGCAVTRVHGTVVELAQPEYVSFPFQELILRDLRIRSSVIASPLESAAMLEFVAEKGIHLESNVFEGLDKVFDVVELANSGRMKGKAVMVVDREQLDKEKR